MSEATSERHLRLVEPEAGRETDEELHAIARDISERVGSLVDEVRSFIEMFEERMRLKPRSRMCAAPLPGSLGQSSRSGGCPRL